MDLWAFEIGLAIVHANPYETFCLFLAVESSWAVIRQAIELTFAASRPIVEMVSEARSGCSRRPVA